MLKIVCGPSGSGKTLALLQSIRRDIEAERRTYLLVPEQQVFVSERDFPALLPKGAGLYLEVVSFSRLADDVARALGGVTQASLEGGVSSLLMWDTLRTLSPALHQYGKSTRDSAALTQLMLSTVEELRASGITAEALEEAADALGDLPLKKKLSDLAAVSAAYTQRIEEIFGTDPSDKLARMAKKQGLDGFFRGCRIYIDSFTSFTAPEYEVIAALLRYAEDVTVSLCTDAPRSSLPHFESVRETVRRLRQLADRAGVPSECLTLPAASDKPHALVLLERDLWRFSIKAEEREVLSDEEKSAVRMVRAANLYEEAEAAAIYISSLVQSGMRYRDIAVTVRDTESYRGVLDAALERHSIPYFLSERTELSQKPPARLILSALRAAAHNYRSSDVIALVKTGLCGIGVREASMFEEYCETWHISGRKFTEDLWSMNPDGLTSQKSERGEVILAAANAVRASLIPPIERLAAELRAAQSAEDLCRALYDYLLRIDLPVRLSERAKEELANGHRREAAETVRLWQLLTEALSTVARMLSGSRLTADEFIAALNLFFSASDLGSVPQVGDCVMIGSADTLRVENVRAALLLGLCEGEFPAAVSDGGLLSEGDKEILEGLNLRFDSRQSVRNSEELLYVYRAMTKARERLYLSTVLKSTDGSAKTPSLAFTRTAFLLQAEAVQFDADAVRAAIGQNAEETEARDLHASQVTSPVTLRLSQTKLQTFALCPYRYHVTFDLKLREEKDSIPSYADDGTFLHYVFEHFLRAALTEDGKLRLPADEEIEPLADRIIRAYIDEVCPYPAEMLDRRLSHLFARLRKLSLLMLNSIMDEIRASSFTPYRFEQSIGQRGENALPPVTFPLENGSSVLLSGKIDRVDLYEAEGHRYLRVVDYKTGEHVFSFEDVRSGLDIQLVLYLFAAMKAEKDAEGFGAHFMFVKTEKGTTEIRRSGFYLDEEGVKNAADTSPDGTYTKRLKPVGHADIDALCEDMRLAVTEIGTRILAGEAEKTPSEDACKFCPVRTHCAVAQKNGKE